MFIQNGAAGLARRRRRYSRKGNPLPVYKNRAGLSVFLVTGRRCHTRRGARLRFLDITGPAGLSDSAYRFALWVDKEAQPENWVGCHLLFSTLLRLAEHPKKLCVGQYWKVLYILVCIHFTNTNASSSTGPYSQRQFPC